MRVRASRAGLPRSDFRLVEIDSTTYNATHQYAYEGVLTTEVFRPLVNGGRTQVTTAMFNKVGKPYPSHWDTYSNRSVWFPFPDYNPGRTADYRRFNRPQPAGVR